MNSFTLEQIEQACYQFISQQAVHDKAHDINHLQRVVSTAKQLCKAEQASAEIVIPAAWLHDSVSFPKNHPDNKRASLLSADKAVEFLSDFNYSNNQLDEIHHAICAHSYSANYPTNSLEAEIVQDADRLDGLGAIGISRCMLVAGKLDSDIYHQTDPFCKQRVANSKLSAIDHFYEKLFKPEQTMKTNAGKQEAKKRGDFMRLFLAELASEIA